MKNIKLISPTKLSLLLCALISVIILMPMRSDAIAIPEKPLPEETIDYTVDENFVPSEDFVNDIEVQNKVPEGYTGIYGATELWAIKDNPAGNYILMKDIDMTSFCESGHSMLAVSFQGILDGNGHTIYGMEEHATPQIMDSASMGLFYKLDGGTIKNLKVSGTYYVDSYWENSTLYEGGIAAQMTEGSTITNCVSDVRMEIYDEETLSSFNLNLTAYIGGIAGIIYSEEGQIPAEISYCSYVGEKIEGYGYSTGGILGRCSLGCTTILSCVNYGNISGLIDTDSHVGGILGSVGEDAALSENPVNIFQCTDYGFAESGKQAGYMIGWVDCPSGKVSVTVTDCIHGETASSDAAVSSDELSCIGRVDDETVVQIS